MNVRAQSATGDWTWGQRLTNSPECVAQLVLTRLLLFRGEWFLNTQDGTPYYQDIVGFNTLYDLEIQARILETPGVNSIINYSSSIDTSRQLSVVAQLDTVYGVTSVSL